MEKKLHLFVRRHPGVGYAVSVLTHPHLAAFADDVDEARADIAEVAARLLARDDGGIASAVTHWSDLRLRRVELTVRAVQHHRLLPVPMKFTALTHAARHGDADDAPAAAARARRGGARAMVVRIPRLELVSELADPADLEAYVEEVVRHQLFMAPLERLLALAYDGEETVETLVVSYRPKPARAAREPDRAASARPAMPPALGEACRRLSDEVAAGTLDRAYERDAEVAKLMESVASSRRASVLLVGATGSGKTAIVHELAHRVASAPKGSEAAGVEVFSTSGGRIIAGMRYLGQWQQRVQRMLDELRVRRAVLHFDALGELVGTGDGAAGLDLARYLLPAVEAGDVTIVCEATPEDVARVERTHAPFVRALRALRVPRLDAARASAALAAVASRIGKARRVRFTDESLARAVDLTERFGDGAALPGGAVQLLRAAALEDDASPGAAASTGPDRRIREVTAADVTRAFTARTGYPREIVDPAIPLDPDAVLERLRARVVGQDGAMVLLRDLVVTLKTGLSDPSRPLGSFLLLGPTGVGKTESALALAEYLFGDPKRMARFDMSEYAAPGSAARLVSTYGGTEGALARRVREQPFGIVLLDEIEKADAGVHDLLLQVLGEGRLTDGTGRTVSFRNTIVMLTSNLGADSVGRSLGFGDATTRDLHAHYLAAAAAFFRPELLNRLDHVVPYHPLAPDAVAQIARRAVARALSREGLGRRGVRARYDDAVVARVASLGFDPRYGARPLHRAIERWVVAPIARVLAARGGGAPPELEIVVRGDGLAVAPTSAPEVATLDAGAVREELARRGRRLGPGALVLRLRGDAVAARRHADWLADRYAAWCARHGASAAVEDRGPEGLALRVDAPTAESAVARLLAVEAGAHEFLAAEGEASRVVVSVEGAAGSAGAGARLYAVLPAPSVLDAVTGLEHVGAWESALADDALDRFVLARAALG